MCRPGPPAPLPTTGVHPRTCTSAVAPNTRLRTSLGKPRSTERHLELLGSANVMRQRLAIAGERNHVSESSVFRSLMRFQAAAGCRDFKSRVLCAKSCAKMSGARACHIVNRHDILMTYHNNGMPCHSSMPRAISHHGMHLTDTTPHTPCDRVAYRK